LKIEIEFPADSLSMLKRIGSLTPVSGSMALTVKTDVPWDRETYGERVKG